MTCRWLRWHLQPLAQSSAREFGGGSRRCSPPPGASPCRKVAELQEMARSPRLAAGGGGEVAAAVAGLPRGALQTLEQPWVDGGFVQVCCGAVRRQPPAGGGCASTPSLSRSPVVQCWAAPYKLFADQIVVIEHFSSGLLTGSSQNICKSGT